MMILLRRSQRICPDSILNLERDERKVACQNRQRLDVGPYFRAGQETVTYVSNIYKYYIAYKLTTEQEHQKTEVAAAR